MCSQAFSLHRDRLKKWKYDLYYLLVITYLSPTNCLFMCFAFLLLGLFIYLCPLYIVEISPLQNGLKIFFSLLIPLKQNFTYSIFSLSG
jgi:hypothetical protein